MKLRYTRRAATELDEVLAYIRERSPQSAHHAQARIRAVVDLLLEFPHAGQPTSKGRLRRVIVSPYPYMIYYRAADDEIVIHGVQHSARRRSTLQE